MTPQPSRLTAYETLQQATARLADASLTIDEANQLLPMVQRLVEELNAERREARSRDGAVVSAAGRALRVDPGAAVPAPIEPPTPA